MINWHSFFTKENSIGRSFWA